MSRRLSRSAGITLLEMTVSAALFSLATVTLTGIATNTEALASDTRAHTRATAELRRNLEALSNVMRGADLATLSGFDTNWQSTNPHFARVIGADLIDRVHSPTEELRWIATTSDVDGVEHPGAVYLISPAGQRLMADRVPQGGFQVRLDGSTLVVSLVTYYTTRDRRTVLSEASTSITLRN